LADNVFRGQVQTGHFGLGLVPSYFVRTEVLLVTQQGTVAQTLADSTGCFRVSTTPGAAGCSESVQ